MTYDERKFKELEDRMFQVFLERPWLKEAKPNYFLLWWWANIDGVRPDTTMGWLLDDRRIGLVNGMMHNAETLLRLRRKIKEKYII